ncbi:hypothetical protein Gohar_009652 [Gossypium harknessii]|uniref:RNase H type-1 domain-containing protein n=1 Tax=Gossypium harknessii TaxID=34285 RepID=A0A7J9GNG6_9ROSI|nr:hypothetical protein [Gossypium harknessii]
MAPGTDSVLDLINSVLLCIGDVTTERILALLWSIWLHRNISFWRNVEVQASYFVFYAGSRYNRLLASCKLFLRLLRLLFVGRSLHRRNGSNVILRANLLGKAVAMKEALCWLKEKQFDHVIIESDCLELINALNDCVSL